MAGSLTGLKRTLRPLCLVLFTAFFVGLALPSKPASALTPNDYPSNLRTIISNYDANCPGNPNKYLLISWASPAGQPSTYTVTVPYNTRYVNLWFITSVFTCRDLVNLDGRTYPGLPNDGTHRASSALRENRDYITAISASPSGGFSINPVGNTAVVGYNSGTRYWLDNPGAGYSANNPIAFQYDAGAGMTSSRSITVALSFKGVNRFSSGAYYCTANGAATTFANFTTQCPTTTVNLTIQINVTPANNPIGNIDAANCSIVGGWAFDRDASSQSVTIHIYVDGTGYNYGPTNGYRGDVNSAYGISGNHGFTWPWPAVYRDGNTHQVDVYAINIGGGSNTYMGRRTVGPCLNFTQTMDVNGPAVVEPGDNFTVSALVRNNGPTRSNRFNADVHGDAAALASLTHTNPDGTQAAPDRYVHWSSASGLPAGGTSQRLLNFRVSSAIATNRVVCIRGYVDPRAWNDASDHTDTHCITIVVPRKPYQSTKGGDAHSGMQLSTDTTSLGCANPPSATSLNGRILGRLFDSTRSSRGQYAISATGSITDYGSFHRSSSDASGALLTFGNNPTRGNLGARRVLCRPDYMKLTPTAIISSATTSQNISTMANAYDGQVILWQGTNTKTITGGVIEPRRRLTILSEGPVLIDGNIRNIAATDDPVYANDPDNIPALMVVSASNIAIHPNVSRLSGWYAANGTISTCSTDPTSDSTMRTSPAIYSNAAGTATCGTQLLIHGMVEATNIFWRRTHGDIINAGGNDAGGNQAGELILFSPELYLALPPGLQSGPSATSAEYDSERPPLN